MHRTCVVTAASLAPVEREQLARRMFDIVCQSFQGADARVIAQRTFFRTPDTRVALFYGRSGELAGFSSAGVLRVREGGVEHAIFDAGVFFDRRYDGGAAATRFGLREALRVRVARPGVRLWFVSLTTSPAPYCLAARTVREVHPHPKRGPSSEVTNVARAFARLRGMQPIGADPFVIDNGHEGRLRDVERVSAAASLRDDPFARYFQQRNPGFLDGHCLLIVVPLHWPNVLSGLFSPMGAPLRARRRRGVFYGSG